MTKHGDDGTIQISQDVLTDYRHAIDIHHLHDQIELTFARNRHSHSNITTGSKAEKASASSAAKVR